MRKAIYPGSFDPVHLGHLDLIARAEKLVDHLVVAVLHNPTKACSFSVDERMTMLRSMTQHLPHVEVTSFEGLLVDFAKSQKANFIIRGIRAFSDFEYEFQMALVNRKLATELETIFLMPKEKYSAVSSKLIREIGFFGGDLSEFCPKELLPQIKAHLKGRKP
ncbi:MAG: pantetheine-phosphate adenylyltransferase [Holophagaceae bacterium]